MSFFALAAVRLAVGVTILIACLASAHVVSGYLVEFPFRRLVEESFLILGWVANWRPLEIFLYDWWPLVRRRDLYRRLSEAAWRPSHIRTVSRKSPWLARHDNCKRLFTAR